LKCAMLVPTIIDQEEINHKTLLKGGEDYGCHGNLI
jgi:hypothetical protein